MPKRRQIITAGGEPTRQITPPVIVTADGEPVVHKDADVVGAHEIAAGIRKIVEKTGGAYVEDALDQEAGVQDVTDAIITGQAEANPSRQEGLTSVTSHEVSGEIANSATDNGALQSPGLPVKVTSGKLGPGAAYSGKNWGSAGLGDFDSKYNGSNNGISLSALTDSGIFIFLGYVAADAKSSVDYVTEDFNRLYSHWAHPSEGLLFYMGEVTAKFDELDVNLANSNQEIYASQITLTNFSEYY